MNQDGVKLYGWFIKPKNKMPVLLHFHGQAESILSHQDIALYCIEKGYGLFMLSYRGHYKSSGYPTEQGLYNDAQAAIKQLKKLGVDKDKIILWGHSLGSVVAVETALKNNVLGIILQSPIKEIKSAAIDVYNFYLTRFRLKIFTPMALKHIKKINFVQKFDNFNKIKDIKCPILILHSKSDDVAPYENSLVLAEQNQNTKLYLCEEGNHWNADWCFERVFEFTNSLEHDKVKEEKVQSKK